MLRETIVAIFVVFIGLGCDQYQLQGTAASDLTSLSKANCNFVRNSKGHLISWKKQVPVTFYFSDKVPSEWRDAIKKAAETWQSASGRKLIQISDSVMTSPTPNHDRRNIIYWMDNGFLSRYQQAQTILRWRETLVQDADVAINAKDFTFYEDQDNDLGKIHLKSLLIHEFGHALGLRHANDVMSVMYPELAFFQIRIEFAPQDTQSVHCEYL